TTGILGREEPIDLDSTRGLEVRAALRVLLEHRLDHFTLPLPLAVRHLPPSIGCMFAATQTAQSSTMRTAPFSTGDPALTSMRATTPSTGDFSSFSIFIASMTTTPCPAVTL